MSIVDFETIIPMYANSMSKRVLSHCDQVVHKWKNINMGASLIFGRVREEGDILAPNL